MKKVEIVKKKIKEKFGSYSEFARLAEIDRYEMQKKFLTARQPDKEYVVRMQLACDQIEIKPKYKIVTYKLFEQIKDGIAAKGGVIKFCLDNPEFTSSTIFAVLSRSYKPIMFKGKMMMQTPLIEDVCKKLEIKFLASNGT